MRKAIHFSSLMSLLLVSSMLLVSGCSSEPNFYYIPPVNQEARYTQAVQKWVDALRQEGITVAQTGETVRLILPSDRLFIDQSSNLDPDFIPTLKQVAVLLAMLEATSVQVTGYTDNLGPAARNVALSSRQAQLVAAYVWKQGADARLLYSQGYGAADPVSSNATASGRALNRRVEICFQYVPFSQRPDL